MTVKRREKNHKIKCDKKKKCVKKEKENKIASKINRLPNKGI